LLCPSTHVDCPFILMLPLLLSMLFLSMDSMLILETLREDSFATTSMLALDSLLDGELLEASFIPLLLTTMLLSSLEMLFLPQAISMLDNTSLVPNI